MDNTYHQIIISDTPPSVNYAWLYPTDSGYELRFYCAPKGRWVVVSKS